MQYLSNTTTVLYEYHGSNSKIQVSTNDGTRPVQNQYNSRAVATQPMPVQGNTSPTRRQCNSKFIQSRTTQYNRRSMPYQRQSQRHEKPSRYASLGARPIPAKLGRGRAKMAHVAPNSADSPANIGRCPWRLAHNVCRDRPDILAKDRPNPVNVGRCSSRFAQT